MSNPDIIYKKFHKYKPVEDFNGHQWFALSDNYGTVYGDISKSYNFKKSPKLLNIGDADVRVMIETEVKNIDPNLLAYCHPDEQYSGTNSNKKYHDILKNIYGEEYDGTIIDENQLHGNSKYPISELEGPSEIVIWKDHGDLLEELPEGNMGKGIRKNKKRRSNKRRSNKRRSNKRRSNKRRSNKRRSNKRK
jgi:hypothetical protein